MVMNYLLALLLAYTLATPALAAKASKASVQKRIAQLESMTAQKLGRDKRALDTWMKTKRGSMPRVSPRLLKAYYFLGTLYAQLYASHDSGEEDKRDVLHFRRAKYYLGAAAAYEHEIDKVETRLDFIDKVQTDRKRLISKSQWRVLFQYMSYQELALLKDSVGEEKIYSPQRGFCAGGQFAYGDVEHEWTFDICGYVTSGNVGAENINRYFQDSVSSKGILFKPSYWKLLSDGEAGLGFGLPVMLRTVDYTEPAGTTVESRRAVPFGFSVDGRWKLTKKVHLTTTAAMLDGSLLWSFGGLYDL
jgi:hypothetical protein